MLARAAHSAEVTVSTLVDGSGAPTQSVKGVAVRASLGVDPDTFGITSDPAICGGGTVTSEVGPKAHETLPVPVRDVDNREAAKLCGGDGRASEQGGGSGGGRRGRGRAGARDLR